METTPLFSLDSLASIPQSILSRCDSVRPGVMDEGLRVYHLRPRDALHVAAMPKCGCFDLVSHDSDFDRVPTETAWR
jgi:predicted nucleic acid-binding protein